MRLGISSWTYAWAVGVPGHAPERPLGALDLLERARDLGVRVVQVGDNLPLHRLPPDKLEAFGQRARELGMEIEVGTRGIAGGNLAVYLGLAARLRSTVLRVIIDTTDHHPAEDEVAVTIRRLMPAFERAGVFLAIENHDRFNAGTLARIVQRAGSEFVGICLDTANSFGALEGPEVVVDILGPWVVNLHVKDFTIFRASHGMGFAIEGRPAGQGRLDVPWLLRRLRDLGRDPNAILELWTPREETLAATMIKEDAWAASSVAYLRQFIED